MKDEEMAEEYRKSLKQRLIDEDNFERLEMFDENVEEAFLAGLKASKSQWHDLREDPNDLPKEPNEKMRVNETWVYVKFFDNTYGVVDKGALNNYSGAIAWCELPTFDKE